MTWLDKSPCLSLPSSTASQAKASAELGTARQGLQSLHAHPSRPDREKRISHTQRAPNLESQPRGPRKPESSLASASSSGKRYLERLKYEALPIPPTELEMARHLLHTLNASRLTNKGLADCARRLAPRRCWESCSVHHRGSVRPWYRRSAPQPPLLSRG